MKKLLALLSVSLVLCSVSFADTLTFLNGSRTSGVMFKLYIENRVGEYKYLNRYRIPSGSSIEIDIGNDSYRDYGYKKENRSYVQRCHSDEITLYP